MTVESFRTVVRCSVLICTHFIFLSHEPYLPYLPYLPYVRNNGSRATCASV